TGSGIYRHTWLMITDPIHIDEWGTFVKTPSISPQGASVEITTSVMNEGDRDASCDLTTEILDERGTVVQQGRSTMSIQHGRELTFDQRLSVPTPALWSVATPNLYRV